MFSALQMEDAPSLPSPPPPAAPPPGEPARASMTTSAICVLGQSLDPGGAVPPMLAERVAAAAELHRELPSAPLIVTGGDPAAAGRSEASIMSDLLVFAGVDKKCIVLDELAQNTVQNALQTLPLVASDVAELHVVTSDFHMPRATYVFEAAIVAAGRADSLRVVPSAVSTAACGTEPADSPVDVSETPSVSNAQGRLQRLLLELRMLSSDFVESHLPSHGDAGGLALGALAPLPPARLQAALAQVQEMIGEESCVDDGVNELMDLPEELLLLVGQSLARPAMAAAARASSQLNQLLAPQLGQMRARALGQLRDKVKGTEAEVILFDPQLAGKLVKLINLRRPTRAQVSWSIFEPPLADSGPSRGEMVHPLGGEAQRRLLGRERQRLDDNDARMLSDLLVKAPWATSLLKLQLGANTIADEGAAAIAHALGAVKKLRELYLYHNQIGDVGAAALAAGLAAPTAKGRAMHLECLSLEHNLIGSPGASCLAAAIAHRPRSAKRMRTLFFAGNAASRGAAVELADACLLTKCALKLDEEE